MPFVSSFHALRAAAAAAVGLNFTNLFAQSTDEQAVNCFAPFSFILKTTLNFAS